VAHWRAGIHTGISVFPVGCPVKHVRLKSVILTKILMNELLSPGESPMRRASFFLTVVAGLVASLALASSSHAGTVLETAVIITPNGIGGTAGDVEISYNSGTLDHLDPVFNVSGTLAGDATITPLSGGAAIQFTTPTTGGTLFFDIDIISGSPTVGSFNLTDTVDSTFMNPIGLSVGSQIISTVPEPASLALLGIGMASFFTYRRFFSKRAATA
jgi:hypothetical protein